MGAYTVQRRNATHVVEYDPEVDGTTPSGDEPEYCRTIAVDKQAGLAQVRPVLCRLAVVPRHSPSSARLLYA